MRQADLDRWIILRLTILYNRFAHEPDDQLTRHCIFHEFGEEMRERKAVGEILDFKIERDVERGDGSYRRLYDFIVSWEHHNRNSHVWYLTI